MVPNCPTTTSSTVVDGLAMTINFRHALSISRAAKERAE
jgi:hypothetical protein